MTPCWAAALCGAAAGVFVCAFARRTADDERKILAGRRAFAGCAVLTAIAWALLVSRWPLRRDWPLAAAALCFAEFHALTDLSDGYIYDRAVAASLAAALALRLSYGVLSGAKEILLGMAAGAVPLALIVLVTRGGMGWGDVFLMAGLGALLGWKLTALTLYGGIVSGGVAALFLLLAKRVGRKDALPLAPFLLAGLLFALWAAPQIGPRLGTKIRFFEEEPAASVRLVGGENPP